MRKFSLVVSQPFTFVLDELFRSCCISMCDVISVTSLHAYVQNEHIICLETKKEFENIKTLKILNKIC